MRLPFLIAALMLLAGPASAETGLSAGPVQWTIEPADRSERVNLEISRRTGNSHWTIGRTIDAASLQGLGQAQLSSDGGPVRFRISRDAGTLDCEGVVRRRHGTG